MGHLQPAINTRNAGAIGYELTSARKRLAHCERMVPVALPAVNRRCTLVMDARTALALRF